MQFWTEDGYLQDFVELNKVPQYHIAMRFKHCQSHEKDEFVSVVIRPKDFPKSEDIIKRKFSLECDEDPSKV